MVFKKYPSIENHHRTKEINWWLSRFPEIADARYIIQEKIHGSNVQFVICPNKPVRIFSRKLEICPANTGFGWVWGLVDGMYAKPFNRLQTISNNTGNCLRIYGEAFGHQKGVTYGGPGERFIAFFDLMINDVWQPAATTIDWFNTNLIYMLVPQLAICKGLSTALAYPNNGISNWASAADDNIMEGIVIKPYGRVFGTSSGSLFYIKSKNKKFVEKTRTTTTVPRVVNSAVERLHLLFLEYINENRVLSVFSKHGEIESTTQFADYIRLVINDASADFIKDHPEFKVLGRQDRGQVTKAGGYILTILKKYL